MSALLTDASRTVEGVAARIGELVRERQDLRADGAAEDVLERNRRRIVELQRELARALIERYSPQVRTA